MVDRDLIEYFIRHTDERFEKLEAKIDSLIAFRFMLIGAAAAVSGIVSVLTTYLLK